MTAASLSAIKPFLDPLGIRLVGIGFEEVGLKKFIASNHFAGELYLDTQKSMFKSVECKTASWTTLWGVFSRDVLRMYDLAKQRKFENNFEGDYSQFGGVFLIDANGVTRYLQVQSKENFQIDTKKIMEVIGVTPPVDFDPLPGAEQTLW
jgi:prostamide/prostaglandin F2alpha synthase